jgi:hypothetical protein
VSDIKDLQTEAHNNAVEKGFWEGKDPEKNIPEAIALMHSELSEALEEFRRDGLNPRFMYFSKDGKDVPGWPPSPVAVTLIEAAKQGYKPEGIAAEFADVVIRIMDNCEALGIPLDTAIRIKMAYNKTRSYKHGGKRI